MRILVAGITGQLGTAFAEVAAERGVDLVPLVRRHRPGRLPFERVFPALANARVTGDARAESWGLSGEPLDALASTVDVVLNLAAETNWAGNGRDLYAANVLGARHGFELTRELGRRSGRRLLYCTASSVYVAGGALGRIAETQLPADRHRTFYEHSKWLAERELALHHRPGDPDVLISRLCALVGDSRTGRTHRRNSLYLLAERWDELPVRLLPAMPDARVDVLPRDVAAAALLDSIEGMVRAGPQPEPVITHLCAGEQAPTIHSLLAAAKSISPLHNGKRVRLVSASAEFVLWLSANAQRFLPMNTAWRNSVIGLRYIGLDRVMERGRLADLTDGPLPAPETELLARLIFDLPAPDRPVAPADRGLSRFQP